jgi:hypothetical protein
MQDQIELTGHSLKTIQQMIDRVRDEKMMDK